MQSPEPIIQQQQTYSNAYHHRDEPEEEDEWAENLEPIKVEPTQSAVAPLATLDEHDDASLMPTSYRSDYVKQQTNNNVSETASQQTKAFSALALYDYQAADDDEISFDPNDVITDIIPVLKNLYFLNLFKFKKIYMYLKGR